MDAKPSRKRANPAESDNLKSCNLYTDGNGTTHEDQAHDPERLGARSMTNRKELMRLIQQALYSLELQSAAKDI